MWIWEEELFIVKKGKLPQPKMGTLNNSLEEGGGGFRKYNSDVAWQKLDIHRH